MATSRSSLTSRVTTEHDGLDSHNYACSSPPLVVGPVGRQCVRVGYGYNAARDEFHDLSPWHSDALRSNIQTEPMDTIETSLEIENKLTDRLKFMHVSAELQLSVLSGLVKVEGAASYLNEDLSSSQVARVVYSIDATTKSVSLTMDHLSAIQEKGVVSPESPITHIITSVIYGVKGILVFEMQVDKSHTKEEIEGSLKLHVEKFAAFSVDAKADVSIRDHSSIDASKITIHLSGDIIPTTPVTTFESAIAMIQKDFTRENIVACARAQTLRLTPKESFMTTQSILYHEINATLREQVVEVMSEYRSLKVEIQGLAERCRKNHIQPVQSTATILVAAVGGVTSFLAQQLQSLLPEIRKNPAKCSVLQELLLKVRKSAFGPSRLRDYLQKALNQCVFILEGLIQPDKPTAEQLEPTELSTLTCRPDPALVLVLYIPSTDVYLTALQTAMLTCDYTMAFVATGPVAWQEDSAFKCAVKAKRDSLKATRTQKPMKHYLCFKNMVDSLTSAVEVTSPSVELVLVKDYTITRNLDTASMVSTNVRVPTQPGTIILYQGNTPPPGYLACNGAQISTTEYPELFKVLCPRWSGELPGTFSLPQYDPIDTGRCCECMFRVWYKFSDITLGRGQLCDSYVFYAVAF
ncbi:Stonustoxin subunit alpha [Pelomyxa schiedti]|nr:Stonustoxin subunit alpha [Pelomyxa schiedti]